MSLLADGIEFQQRIRVPERKTAVGIGQGTSSFDHVWDFVAKYLNGTGSNKIDAVWSTQSSGGASVDLRGSLNSVLDGSTVNFPIVMGIFLKNLSTVSGEYISLGGGSNPFISWLLATGDGLKVGPSGFFQLWSPIDGYATSAGTADILTLAAGSGTPSYDMLIVGRSA